MELLGCQYLPHNHLAQGGDVTKPKKFIKRKYILAVDQNSKSLENHVSA